MEETYNMIQHAALGSEAQNHKYISRKMGANGKWEYTYADDTAKTSRMRTKYSNFERRMGILQRRQERIEKMADGDTYVDKRNPKGTMSKAEKMKETLKKIQNLTRRMGHYQDKYKELKGKNADIKSETHGGKSSTKTSVLQKGTTQTSSLVKNNSGKSKSSLKKTKPNVSKSLQTENTGKLLRATTSGASTPSLRPDTRKTSTEESNLAKINKKLASRYR